MPVSTPTQCGFFASEKTDYFDTYSVVNVFLKSAVTAWIEALELRLLESATGCDKAFNDQ